MSKTRFFAAQALACLEDDLWINNATHANTMAKELEAVFQKSGINLTHPVESNELFVAIPKEIALLLENNQVKFYPWRAYGKDIYRFVTSCFTQIEIIKALDQLLTSLVGKQ